MISLEILQSPDSEMIGEFKSFKNFLSLGQKKGDLLLNDPEVEDYQGQFELGPKSLILYPKEETTVFWVNGKRTMGKTHLKVGDQITVGKTVLLLKETLFSENPKDGEILEKNHQLLMTKESWKPYKEILSLLEEELKKAP